MLFKQTPVLSREKGPGPASPNVFQWGVYRPDARLTFEHLQHESLNCEYDGTKKNTKYAITFMHRAIIRSTICSTSWTQYTRFLVQEELIFRSPVQANFRRNPIWNVICLQMLNKAWVTVLEVVKALFMFILTLNVSKRSIKEESGVARLRTCYTEVTMCTLSGRVSEFHVGVLISSSYG